ncbi:prion-like-(Q/N-rich) domain-bearing protein 25 [Microplitis demolitor]|uniref:prion-like-(Q/N-rich) domain-bearing protein 25 n=1 Tax=Microplitis demolitor TaxID=69319 RepID=UPI00235B70B2|nr:prion-like-(Q/N-rich) domain-bearing protein 25 [Microplitis demolitor]
MAAVNFTSVYYHRSGHFSAYIGKPCESNQDCKNILHSVCSEHGVCICDDNYVVVNRDKCVPLIDGACSSNKECRIENSVCVDNKCQCGTNYSSLNNNKCILCDPDHFDPCNKTNVCRAIRWAEKEEKFLCLNPVMLGEHCQYDTDCLRLDFATCSREARKCTCLPNYGLIKQNLGCVALIGGPCDRHQRCLIDNSICINSKCQCNERFTMKSNKECVITSIGESCKRDTDCRDILHIGCSVNKKCVCKDNHIFVNNSTCLPLLGEFCWSDERCAPANSMCINNRCQCKSNYTALTKTLCVKLRLGRSCNSNQDCEDTSNAICSNHGICICKNNYVVVNGEICAPIIGGVCSNNKECKVKHSVCINHKCQCTSNYLSVSDYQCIFAKK